MYKIHNLSTFKFITSSSVKKFLSIVVFLNVGRHNYNSRILHPIIKLSILGVGGKQPQAFCLWLSQKEIPGILFVRIACWGTVVSP